MKTFEFSIIASGLNPEADDFADRFFNAGCDDATISFQKGHIILDFARDAESISKAIISAVENVQNAGAHIDRIEPDPLVSLSDIAARVEISRAAVSNYAKGQRGKDFPLPVARVTSDSPLYEWASVAKWLVKRAQLPKEVAIEAEAVRIMNGAIEGERAVREDDLANSLKDYEQELEAA